MSTTSVNWEAVAARAAWLLFNERARAHRLASAVLRGDPLALDYAQAVRDDAVGPILLPKQCQSCGTVRTGVTETVENLRDALAVSAQRAEVTAGDVARANLVSSMSNAAMAYVANQSVVNFQAMCEVAAKLKAAARV